MPIRNPLIAASVLAALLASFAPNSLALAQTASLQNANGSPLAGISFEDKPYILPLQRNFQMAMLAAGSELGRTCGPMEAYGWRLDQSEQARVNNIFNETVDHLRAQGYEVQTKTPAAISKDITLFTADRSDKHLLFMWSAGEIGLVNVICQTNNGLNNATPLAATKANPADTESALLAPQDHTQKNTLAGYGSPFAQQQNTDLVLQDALANFSPLGEWNGNYTCSSGTNGVTLAIKSLKGTHFEGTFSFYPTPKNPYVQTGRYAISGEYDASTARILINPGKWLQKPRKPVMTTIIIGSFAPTNNSFSGFFQGITGCTSVEAKRTSLPNDKAPSTAQKPKRHKLKKKTAASVTNTTPRNQPMQETGATNAIQPSLTEQNSNPLPSPQNPTQQQYPVPATKTEIEKSWSTIPAAAPPTAPPATPSSTPPTASTSAPSTVPAAPDATAPTSQPSPIETQPITTHENAPPH